MRIVLAWLCGLFLAPIPGAAAEDPAAFFETRIRPVLVERCFSCHSTEAKKVKAGLYVDSREGLLKGGESGPSVVAGDVDKSKLIEAIRYTNVDLQMPPKDRLSDQQIRDFEQWVKEGAVWGKSTGAVVAKVEEFDLQKRRGEHWAWHAPTRAVIVPRTKDTAWCRTDLDRFIVAKLEERGLSPAREADKRTLLRRVYFDLTGLGPRPDELDAFVVDSSPDALDKVVDRLLGSPRFGERWARHWLDLVRYAETLGHEFDYAIPNAWRYRDYVIRALNADVPYNQFVLEHVAGDMLPQPRRSPAGDNESVIGTGWWFFGEGTHSPVDVRLNQADTFDNRIDVLGKTFLGMTVACARCHDHKFDAISTADYYGMYGFVKGTRYAQSAVNEKAIEEATGRVRQLKRELPAALAGVGMNRVEQFAALLAKSSDAPAREEVERRAGDVEMNLEEWRTQGVAFESAQAGDFISGTDKRPVAVVATGAKWHSGLTSRRLEGAVRSPSFVIDRKFIHVRAAGMGTRINVVVDNFMIIRNPIYGGLKREIKSDKPGWVTIDVSMWKGHEAYVEVLDQTVHDPGGPGGAGDGWVALERGVRSDEGPAKPAKRKAGEDWPALLRSTLELWGKGTLASSADAAYRAALLQWCVEHGFFDSPGEPVIGLLKELASAEKQIPAPVYVAAAVDGEADAEAVFIRGNPRNLGPKVEHGSLTALRREGQHCRTRLELAGSMVDPANPLTARVMVNRVWHHLFGRGIVASVDNFGVLGERPAHPELLDHLAQRFVAEGWSVKRLIRSIVLSSTYRMSSSGDAAAEAVDPQNVLLHRANVRRLEAEAIRDQLLAVSGRLDGTMGGPSVPVHLTEFMEGRGRPASGPLDGNGRRSVYLEVRRNFLSPMLLAFDMPIPFNTTGRRSVSNVPAQALILMNDPFVMQQARLWGEKVSKREGAPPDRVRAMFKEALARESTAEEMEHVVKFVETLKNNGSSDAAAWTEAAHALFNAKDFVFVK